MPERAPATTRSHRTEWLLLGLALLLLGLTFGDSGYRYIEQTERDRLQVPVRVIEDKLGRQIEAVDQALRAAQTALVPSHAERTGPAQSRVLMALYGSIPGLRTMAHIGPDGTVIAASRDDVIGIDHAQWPRFKRAQAQPDPSLLQVAEPYLSAQGVWTLALVRVLTGPAGEFAGIVEASLEPAYLNVVVGSVLHAPDMRAALMHGNGSLFLNMPANDATLGTSADQPGSFFRRHRDSGMRATLLRGTTLAGEDRMAAVRTLQRDDRFADCRSRLTLKARTPQDSVPRRPRSA